MKKLKTDNLMSGTWLQVRGNNGDPDYTVLLLSPCFVNLQAPNVDAVMLTVWCPMSSRTLTLRATYIVETLGRVAAPFPDRSAHLRIARK